MLTETKWIGTMMLAVAMASPGMVSANCLDTETATSDDPGETGIAKLIQIDQGNGVISCSAFSAAGGPMEPVEDKYPGAVITRSLNSGSITDPISWSISSMDPKAHADLIFAASSDGSRCLQNYVLNAKSGKTAAGIEKNNNKDLTIVACTDGEFEELPPEPPTPPTPPDITEAGCPDVFQNAINIFDDEWDVMILNGSPKGAAGGEGRSAICIDQTLNGGDPNDPNPPALNRCANRCIVPDAANDPDWIPLIDPTTGLPPSERLPGGLCTDTRPGFDGRFPIACRVCELSNIVQSDPFEPDLQFCWEQGQDVKNGTFKNPQPDQGNQGWDVNGKFGSTCYLISGKTRSGYPYSYWAPSGCPN